MTTATSSPPTPGDVEEEGAKGKNGPHDTSHTHTA
jgi:hypothetical protein